ncbi:MAG: DUF2238 domain-containing protein [Deltaproteobacteria bacterium]|nr:DUF2238 domain-containing protein [Deltaproteobacteria bacterium]
MRHPKNQIYHICLLITLLLIYIWSFIKPSDIFTWFLEMLPVLIGLAVLLLTYRRFRLTDLIYTLIWVHGMILLVGAHYTYAQVPLFDWIKDFFELSRNHYDRLGHFAQGFVPAMIAREVLIRTSPLRGSKWLMPLVVYVCLAISAIYELIEWLVAELTGSAAEAFLGTQGDIWDTQKDMALCFFGASAALFFLSTWHDRQLKEIQTDA